MLTFLYFTTNKGCVFWHLCVWRVFAVHQFYSMDYCRYLTQYYIKADEKTKYKGKCLELLHFADISANLETSSRCFRTMDDKLFDFWCVFSPILGVYGIVKNHLFISGLLRIGGLAPSLQTCLPKVGVFLKPSIHGWFLAGCLMFLFLLFLLVSLLFSKQRFVWLNKKT